MLELKNIHKTFNPGTINEKVALNGLNLSLDDGDFVTVIGGNGAGKSTMLNAVAGTWFVDEGKITIADIDVTKLPEHKRAIDVHRLEMIARRFSKIGSATDLRQADLREVVRRSLGYMEKRISDS